MTTSISIAIRRLPHGAGLPLPAYATAGAAGMDVVAAENATLMPGQRAAIATGVEDERQNEAASYYAALRASGNAPVPEKKPGK